MHRASSTWYVIWQRPIGVNVQFKSQVSDHLFKSDLKSQNQLPESDSSPHPCALMSNIAVEHLMNRIYSSLNLLELWYFLEIRFGPLMIKFESTCQTTYSMHFYFKFCSHISKSKSRDTAARKSVCCPCLLHSSDCNHLFYFSVLFSVILLISEARSITTHTRPNSGLPLQCRNMHSQSERWVERHQVVYIWQGFHRL